MRFSQDVALSRAHAQWLEPDEPQERTYICEDCEHESTEDMDTCPECGGRMYELEEDDGKPDRWEDDF